MKHESPFDESLDLSDTAITLLLSPEHYDILYSNKDIGGSTNYDIGFEDWVDHV